MLGLLEQDGTATKAQERKGGGRKGTGEKRHRREKAQERKGGGRLWPPFAVSLHEQQALADTDLKNPAELAGWSIELSTACSCAVARLC